MCFVFFFIMYYVAIFSAKEFKSNLHTERKTWQQPLSPQSYARNFNPIKADPCFRTSGDQILAVPLEIAGSLFNCYHFRSSNFPFRWGAALDMYFLCYSRCRSQQPSDQYTPRLCPTANVPVIKHMVWCCKSCSNVVN